MEIAAPTPTKTATIPAMITVRAEQGTIETRKEAMIRSRGERLRIPIRAGTLQPKPRIIGIRA